MIRIMLLWMGFLNLISGAVLAQNPELDDYASALREAVHKTWGTVLQPAFVKAADSPEEAALIQNATVNVSDYSDLNAWANYSQENINLAFGLVLYMNNYSDAMVVCQSRPDKKKYFTPYINKLAELASKGIAENNPQSQPAFWKFADLSKEEIDAITAEPNYGTQKQALMVQQLSFIVGHELGHIVLHHLPYSKKSLEQARRDELEADKYGYVLAKKAGFFPVLGVTSVFLVFAGMENGVVTDNSGATHPSSMHRINSLLSFIIDDVRSTPDSSVANKETLIDQLQTLQKSIEDESN